jgi:Sortase domain
VVPRPRRPGRRRWWFLLALGVFTVAFGGVSLLVQTPGGHTEDAGSVPVARVARAQAARPAAQPAEAGSVRPAVALAAPPARLRLLRLDIDAPVLPVSVTVDGLLDVPDNPRQLGWWRASGRPGMPSGSVVINGHVDSATRGLGALFPLRKAKPGDEVLLTSSAGELTRYTVVGRRSYPKTSLPVAEVFARDVGPRLVLITCGGPFDEATRHYADNIVVYAVPR